MTEAAIDYVNGFRKENMENSIIIIRQLILLFALMLAGYYSFKKGWVTHKGSAQISSMIVKIFNPALIIASTAGSEYKPEGDLIITNLIIVAIFFGSLIFLAPIAARILRVEQKNRMLFRIMFTFCNLGFMGIPLVSGLFGEEQIFFVTWYILGFNFLFYSYGIFTFDKMTGKSSSFKPAKMFNSGVIACLIAFLLFLLPVNLPVIAVDSLAYVADLCVPLSMLVTGFALAQADLKMVFSDVKMYFYVAIKMIALPIAIAVIIKLVGGTLDPVITGIMILMYGMPNASLPIIVCEEYDIESEMLSSGYALSTILCIITLPLVTYFI